VKEYPLKDNGNKITKICECGHANYLHGIARKECKECGCPEYYFEQELTLDEAIKLENTIRRKNKKIGYST